MRLLLVTVCLAGLALAQNYTQPLRKCRYLPGDEGWPSVEAWHHLNSTIDGRLIATVPIGSPCHDPTFDAEACAELQTNWNDPRIHLPSSSSIMQHFFTNRSCDPFTCRTQPCKLGNYVAYAVDVATPQQVATAVLFAKKNNIRVVIRNTGHDFLGRSTGRGALSIWTHHLDSTEIVEYSSPVYTGPVLVAGAGVLGSAAIEAVDEDNRGLVVLTGDCPSVGLVGGYTQGGGHSPLSNAFGLAADQVLEYEVVTADGRVVIANFDDNTDLYWALSGGGGGTYGVVTKMTVRLHSVGTVGGARVRILASSVMEETYRKVVTRLHELLPEMSDKGASVTYILNAQFFSVGPITAVNSTAEFVRNDIMAPFTHYLRELEVPFSEDYSTLSYRDHYDKYLGPLPWGTLRSTEWQYGGRLIPRQTIEENNAELQSVFQELVSKGVTLVGSGGPFLPSFGVSNAAIPAWRTTLIALQLLTPWTSDPVEYQTMLDSQRRMTDEFIPALKAVTPNSGTYMNEADFREPDWKREFFGTRYRRLLDIKKEWDRDGLFYVLKGVGSDVWNVDEGGRMCRTD